MIDYTNIIDSISKIVVLFGIFAALANYFGRSIGRGLIVKYNNINYTIFGFIFILSYAVLPYIFSIRICVILYKFENIIIHFIIMTLMFLFLLFIPTNLALENGNKLRSTILGNNQPTSIGYILRPMLSDNKYIGRYVGLFMCSIFVFTASILYINLGKEFRSFYPAFVIMCIMMIIISLNEIAISLSFMIPIDPLNPNYSKVMVKTHSNKIGYCGRILNQDKTFIYLVTPYHSIKRIPQSDIISIDIMIES
jgi:hypothetical protein